MRMLILLMILRQMTTENTEIYDNTETFETLVITGTFDAETTSNNEISLTKNILYFNYSVY